MVVSFADILLLVIVFFGVFGSFRGVRSVALTTGAIFFAIVVVLFSGDLVVYYMRRIGVPLTTPDTVALFKAVLFVFIIYMATLVIGRVVVVGRSDLSRSEKVWGLVLGLLNGFLVMAMLERYISDVIAASARPGSPVSVGLPAMNLTHPTPNSWTVSFISSTFTLLPPASGVDLWGKLPIALVLLLLFLGFVFVGTLYGRLSRSRG